MEQIEIGAIRVAQQIQLAMARSRP